MTTRIAVDGIGDNADWTKQAWDLQHVQTWEDVRAVFGMGKSAFKRTVTYRLALRGGTLPRALRE